MRRRAGAASSSSPGLTQALGGDILDQLNFNEEWEKVRVKYDTRHFLGNWFLLAMNKSSPLFKYFCAASSDAIHEEVEGERDRLKGHLRKVYRQGAGAAEEKRVKDLIKVVPRRYWRRHCESVIPEPRRLARRLLEVYP